MAINYQNLGLEIDCSCHV